jgi:peptidyl-tRNA hydrolase, PTH1 family
MKILCGLGNPGREYERHRHNVGFMVVECLARRLRIELVQAKFDAVQGGGTVRGQKILLMQPQLFMNRSGRSLSQACRFYKVEPPDVLVIHDELDLPFERLALKAGGGAGGHNGLRSIIESCGTDGFHRLRFGIGKPEGPDAKQRVTGHVLGNFSGGEQTLLPALLERAAEMAECWAAEGLAAAMNQYHRR